MKKLLLIIAVLFGLNAYSQSEIGYLFVSENFIPLDKQLHGAAGIGIGAMGYSFAYGITNENRSKSKIIATAAALVFGLVKETADTKTTGFDWADLGYTTVGGVVGAYTFDFIFARAKKRNDKRDKIIAMTDKFYSHE
jgi:hypothetical protein